MHFFSNLLNQRLKTNSNVLDQFPFFANSKNLNATQNFVSFRVKQIATIFQVSRIDLCMSPFSNLIFVSIKSKIRTYSKFSIVGRYLSWNVLGNIERKKKKKKKKQICRSDVKGNRADGAIRHVRPSNRWQELLVLPPRETWSLNLNWGSMKCAEPKCEIRAMVILYFSNLRS